MARIPLHPKQPERVCWGCDKYCPANDLRCGNGTIRTPHPVEIFGEDWMDWENEETSAPLEPKVSEKQTPQSEQEELQSEASIVPTVSF